VADVELRLPPGLFNGDSRGLLVHLGLVGRHLDADRWAVRARTGGEFVTSQTLADETGFDHRFDFLSETAESDLLADDPELVARFDELMEQLAPRLGIGDQAAMFHHIQSNIIGARRDDLIEVVRTAYQAIGRMPEEATGLIAFPHRSVQLVRATDLLIRRIRLPAILLRFAQDPDALTNLNVAQQSGAPLFGTSTDWYHEVIGVVHYLGPLLGCLGPRFWSFPGNRPMATVLFSLGRDINGYRQSPMEVLQLLPSRNHHEVLPELILHPSSGAHAIHWWSFRLNQMFKYLTDPTSFTDSNGEYSPHENQHWMLTFGQIFGLMTSLQTAGRDFSAQRVMMNSLLDTFADRIYEGTDGFERLCTLKHAKSVADQARRRMPASVAALLMPSAERAIAALERIQEGFFIQRQRGDEAVRLFTSSGLLEERSPERATALLLKVYRNATHGFGHRKGAKAKNEIEASVLAHHHGELPRDIVYLPYLYLLDILCNPARTAASVARKVALPN
jgi:hypothetical protein